MEKEWIFLFSSISVSWHSFVDLAAAFLFGIQPYSGLQVEAMLPQGWQIHPWLCHRYINGCVTQLGKPEKCQHELYSHLHWQDKSKDAVLGIGACLYYFISRVCIETGWKQLCAKKPREELNVNFFLLIISYLCYCWVFHPCNCVNMYVLVRHLLAFWDEASGVKQCPPLNK